MAAEPVDIMQECLGALQVLYGGAEVSTEDRSQAVAYTAALQDRVDIWAIAETLLSMQGLRMEFYFFAANSLVQRLRKSASDLGTPEVRQEFRTVTLKHLMAFAEGGQFPKVRQKLAQCVALVYLHLIGRGEAAPTALPELVDVLNQAQYALALLEVLDALPDQLADYRIIIERPHALRADAVYREFAPFCLDLLHSFLTQAPSTEYQLKVLRTYRSWCESRCVSLKQCVAHPLFHTAFEKMSDPALLEDCCSIISSILKEYGKRVLNQQQSLQQRAADGSEIGQAAAAAAEAAAAEDAVDCKQLINELVHVVAVFDSLIEKEPLDIRAQESVVMVVAGYARAFVRSIEAADADGLAIMQVLVHCMTAPHAAVVTVTGPAWIAIYKVLYQREADWRQEALLGLDRKALDQLHPDQARAIEDQASEAYIAEKDAPRAAARAIYHELLVTAVQHLVRVMEMPADSAKLDAYELDELRSHRYSAVRILEDIALLLSVDTVLDIVFGRLQTVCAEYRAQVPESVEASLVPDDHESLPWQPLEGMLFAVRHSNRFAHSDRKYMPALMQLLPTLKAHFKLRAAALFLIEDYGSWLRANPTHLPSILTYVVSSLTYSVISPTACDALRVLCNDCWRPLREYIPTLIQVYERSSALPFPEQQQIQRGLVGVLSQLPQAELEAYYQGLAGPVCERIQAAATAVMVENRPVESLVTDLAADISRLEILFRELQPGRNESGDTVRAVAASLLTYSADTLQAALQAFRREPIIVEGVNKCWQHGLKVAETHAGAVLTSLVDLLVGAYADTPDSAYLYSGSVAVKIFAVRPDAHPVLGNLLTQFTQLTAKALENPAFYVESPNIVDDFFALHARFLKYATDFYLSPEMVSNFGAAMTLGLNGLNTAHETAFMSICTFYSYAIMVHVNLSPLNRKLRRVPSEQQMAYFDAIIAENGAQMIGLLLTSISGPRTVTNNKHMAEVFDAMFMYNADVTLQIVEHVLEAPEMQGTVDAKSEFLTALRESVNSSDRMRLISLAVMRLAEFISPNRRS